MYKGILKSFLIGILAVFSIGCAKVSNAPENSREEAKLFNTPENKGVVYLY